jgi:hypothetical protein
MRPNDDKSGPQACQKPASVVSPTWISPIVRNIRRAPIDQSFAAVLDLSRVCS